MFVLVFAVLFGVVALAQAPTSTSSPIEPVSAPDAAPGTDSAEGAGDVSPDGPSEESDVAGAAASAVALAGWPRVEQEVLPRLVAREEAAASRTENREQFLRGEAPFEEAYPRLSRTALGNPPLLRGRLAQLAEAEVDRAKEVGSVPLGVTEAEHLTRWRDTVGAAHAAEAEAAELERRLLVSVLARLEVRPELRSTAVQWARSPLEVQSHAVQFLPEDVPPATRVAWEARAAEADAALARLDALLHDLRLAGVRGEVPSPSADLEGLIDEGWECADRLVLLRPSLAPDEARRVTEALRAYWEGAGLEALQAEVDALRERVAGVEAPEEDLLTLEADKAQAAVELAAAELRLESLPEGAEAAQRAFFALDVARAEAADELARLRHLAKAGLVVAEDAETAEAQAELAEIRAQQAEDAAGEDERAQQLARIERLHAEAKARAAERQKALVDAREREDANKLLQVKISDQRAEVRGLRYQGGWPVEDQDDADALYTKVRATLDKVRGEASEALEATVRARRALIDSETALEEDAPRLEEARAFVTSLPESVPDKVREDSQATLQSWQDSLRAELEASRTLVGLATRQEQVLLAMVHDARVTKRDLYPHLSPASRAADQDRFLEDLQREAAFLVPSVTLGLKQRELQIENPRRLVDTWEELRSLGQSFAWTLLAGIVWFWARRRANRWAMGISQRALDARPELRPSDAEALRDPMARAIRNSTDLLLGQVLLWTLGSSLVEVQFLVRAYLYLSMFRALLALFDLAVVPQGDVRPALVVIRREGFRLARSTVWWLLLYFVVYRLLHWVLWDVAQLDTLAGLLEGGMRGVLALLVVWTLFRWEPVLRESLRRRMGRASTFTRWLIPERGGFLLRIPRALVQVVVLTFLLVLELAQRFAREGTSLSWVFTALNRYRIKEQDPAQYRPIEEEVRDRIVEGETMPDDRVHRDELSRVAASLAEWHKTGLRGLVAVVGDRGMGKTTACHEVVRLLEGSGLAVSRGEVPHLIRTIPELFAWLCTVVGSEQVARTQEEMVQVLDGAERRAVVLEEVHRTFARRVGGLDVIQALLYVLNATSHRHFYVVSVHGPAWDYFAATGSMIDCGVFHTVVHLGPMASSQLKALTLARAEAAGVDVDFSSLERPTAFSDDPKLEEDRAISVFYRLLAEATGGNPVAALDVFSRCLERTEDPKLVRAHMGASLTIGLLPELPDEALFVLVALNLHDELGQDELVEVTNLPLSEVRATVRDLLSRGLLIRDGEELRIPDRHRRTVQRTLRRRHFLHLGA